MELGMFSMPSHPPERGLREGWDWDLQTIVWGDELGFCEAWVGEHHAAKWEPHPAPDLLTLAALRATKNIRIGPGGFLLPYYHPAELANRVALLDHLSDGRLNFGIAASGLPSDWEMFGVDGLAGENRDMTAESIEFILNMWTQEPGWVHEGAHWRGSVPVGIPEMDLVHHLRPLQQPHPPIGVAGLSSPSPTLELAGERGWIPISGASFLQPRYTSSHWDKYAEGCEKAGRQAEREDWRVSRSIIVAPTDAEARDYLFDPDGAMCFWFRYLLSSLRARGLQKFIAPDGHPSPDDVTWEEAAESMVAYGSPSTVLDKLVTLRDTTGHFGVLTLLTHEWDRPDFCQRSMRLLAEDVMPAFSRHAQSTKAA